MIINKYKWFEAIHKQNIDLLKKYLENNKANIDMLLIRQALFVNLARAEVSKPLDGLKLNGIGTLQ